MEMTWGKLTNFLSDAAMKKRIPMNGEFELTARCNLKCRMCYVCRKAGDIEAINLERTAGEWINIASEAKDNGLLYLLLTGGEVLIRDDFKTIYDEISMMGFSTAFYTNGTMITPDIAKWLGNNPPSQIDVTLYGASPETYACVTGDASGFERAIRGIDLLLDQGINVQIRTTVIKKNAKDFEQLAEIADSRRRTLGIVNYVSPRREGNFTLPEEERLSPKELAEYEKNVNLYYMRKQNTECLNINSDDFAPQQIDILNTGENFPCNSGKCSFWITWDGRMIPCSLMDSPAVNPFTMGFSKAWQELQDLCSGIPVCSTCTQCSIQDYCMQCPARLKNETGSFIKPAAYLCELAKERMDIDYYDLICRIGGV